MQRTLSIIKPDGTERNLVGRILSMIEQKGLKVLALKKIKLTKDDAKRFYKVHAARPFYEELCETMSEGPVVVSVLEGENAIAKYRELMGATNPAEAAEGTIRKEYALSIGKNTVHGSDASETAQFEIGFFFSQREIEALSN